MQGNFWKRLNTRQSSRRQFLAGAGAGMTAAFLAACGGGGNGGNGGTGGSAALAPTAPEQVQRGGEFVIRRTTNLAHWDPQRSPGGFDPPINDIYSSRLLDVSNAGEMGPNLAERWEQTDELTVTLNLRRDIQFNDGTPFNAEAVKYTVERGQSAQLAAPPRATLVQIRQVEMPDSHTVVLRLGERNAAFLELMAGQAGRVISPTAHQQMGDDRFNRQPISAGPYTVREIVPDGESVFLRNENWPMTDAAGGRLPYFDRVRVKVIPEDAASIAALRTGEIDMDYVVEMPNIPQIRGQRGLAVETLDNARFTVAEYLTNGAPTNNLALRKALNHAMDRNESNQVLAAGLGQPARGPLTELSWAHDPNAPYYEYDPAKVRQYLAEAGFPNGLEIRAASFIAEHGELLQAQLARHNIRLVVDNLELAVFTDRFRARGEYPIGTSSGPVPIGDPFSFWQGRYGAGNLNAGRPQYPEWLELIARSVQVYDREERKKIYSRLQHMDYEWAYRGWNITMPRAMGFRDTMRGLSWLGYNPDFRLAWKAR
jgi:peptide/nickel transport system substrate-binding protein